MNNIGVYLHTPFCLSKCGYCDFYSSCGNAEQYEEYVGALTKSISFFGERFSRNADTLYFGGGTPSLLGGERIKRLIDAVDKAFPLSSTAEITLEANPADNLRDTLITAARSGVNRLSLGVQSGIEDELSILGRRHKNSDVIRTVNDAHDAGIDNISLDLMLGIPKQTKESLNKSLDFLYSLSPTHISSYLLSVEKGTPFDKKRETLDIPDEDKAASLYLFALENLESKGYIQYEISNFAKCGRISNHNMKYWHLDEYLGIGPSAHSFMEGKRFFFPRDTKGFISGNQPIEDGVGGTAEEFVMLSLRLVSGLDEEKLKSLYCIETTPSYLDFCKTLCGLNLIKREKGVVSLTPKGFLVDNYIISEILTKLKIN